MSKKKEIRIEKKLLREAKKKLKSKSLVASLAETDLNSSPKIKVVPDLEKVPILNVQLSSLTIPKQPKTNNSGSRFGYLMTWCARKADTRGSWGWGEERNWCDKEWESIILANINHLQKLDWSEIQNMSSDSGHLMHHDHDISDLCDEAVDRWLHLDLEQFDTVFRFRLGNTKRAWGVILGGHFFLVWFERFHKIYPV